MTETTVRAGGLPMEPRGGSWRGRVLRLAQAVVFQDNAWIVRYRLERSAPPRPGFSFVECRTFAPWVLALYREFGRGFTEKQLRDRFDRGLRFYELREGGQVVATTWLTIGVECFVDEPGVFLALGEGSVYLRDVFVTPEARGRGIFEVLVDSVRAHHPEVRTLWAVVETRNRASRRAHEKYGFAVVGRYDMLHLAGTLMLRIRWPRPLFSSGFKVGRRLLLTGPRFRRFVAARRA